jgi:L-ascorbate metabolism protein UlaG (beta-lactamase superfamily)
MIKPLLQDDALLRDVGHARAEPQALHLWWLGQSGFLVQWNGHHLLLDPYLSDSLTTKYANTDKPHERLSERVIAPERLDFIDVVTSSHNHTDHLDAGTLVPLLKTNPLIDIVVPEANRRFAAERLGVGPERLHGIDAGEALPVDAFEFHAVPAAHEQVDRDGNGRCIYLGYVVRCGPWTLYHSGDTIRFDELPAWLERWEIDVALLPINGRGPERRVAGNLWGREAAQLARDIGATVAIPCHYDLFGFNTATPDEFVRACHERGQHYRVLRLGERWTGSVQV